MPKIPEQEEGAERARRGRGPSCGLGRWSPSRASPLRRRPRPGKRAWQGVTRGRWRSAHASLADSRFCKTSGRSPRDHKTVSLPGPGSEVQGSRAQEPLPAMGAPGLLPLLLLVQACVPGSGCVPAPARGTGDGVRGREGRGRERGALGVWRVGGGEGSSVPQPLHSDTVTALLSAAPHGAAPSTQWVFRKY